MGILLFIGLYIVSAKNYLLFHTLAELFSIAVILGMFTLIWYSRFTIKNTALVSLGIAYLFVGSIDLFHTLSYQGMGIIDKSWGANPATQLWVAGRLMESISLLLFLLFFKKKINIPLIAGIYFLITIVILTAVFSLKIFPDCYIEGIGLTPFKKTTEYIICIILICTSGLLYKKKKNFAPDIYVLFTGSLILTVCAELSFTFYISVYDFFNLMGHYFKIISFFLIYLVFVRSGLMSADQALIESENHYRKLFEGSNDGIILFDFNGNIMRGNSKIQEVLGYSEKEFCHMQIKNIHPSSEWDISDKQMKNVIDQGKTKFESKYLKKDGTIIDIEVSGSVIDRKKNLILGIFRDITDRKTAQKKLWESNELFKKVFNSQIDAIFVFTAGMLRIAVDCNKAATELFGYTKKEIINKPAGKFHVNESYFKNFEHQLYSETNKTGVFQLHDYCMKKKDGTIFPTEHTVLEIKNDSGKRTGWISIVKDLTEQKKMLEEKAILETKLQHAQKMEAIGTLAGGIAHDFNNILFPLIGFAEILKEDIPKESPLQELTDEIMTASLRARDLVKQILTFSHQMNQEITPLKVQLILKEVIKLTSNIFPSTINIEMDIDDTCKKILADPTQIHQLTMNLITNAYHAMQSCGGTLFISLKPVKFKYDTIPTADFLPGDYICLSIEDTGSGIKEEIMDKIFDPYFTTKGVDKGTGLGLSVVHGIIKQYKGEIMVDSIPEKGTCFKIYLPVIEETEETIVKPIPRDLPKGTERVLLIDDEPPVLKIEKTMLQRLGYHVVTESNSAKAIDLFKTQSDTFDLVITDMTMPGITGDMLSKEIIKIKPAIPIIICTGFSEIITAQKAREIGIKEFLKKPVVLSDLALSVRNALEQK
ncbi:PAS domain S-box-containing protein [Desulfobacula phenolica]|uniref:histidine kinase n=1 Tax=Desulfobacula phenolica TaxID=90732 RepID=A0A1H2HWB4_9BACT|nr:PAS domain S-box-containing protein [Desulfobacula phenolica]